MNQAELNQTQSIALLGIMAALYAAVTVVLGPISYGIINLRISDVLLPFPHILGWPMALALCIGCAVANVFGGLGPIDIVLGSLLNLAAGVLVMNRKTCPHWVLAWLYPTLIVGLGVPAYLQFLIPGMTFLILLPEILASTALWSAIGVIIMQAVERALPDIFPSK